MNAGNEVDTNILKTVREDWHICFKTVRRSVKLKGGGWHISLAVSKPLQYFIFPLSFSVKTEVFSEECYVQVNGLTTGGEKVK